MNTTSNLDMSDLSNNYTIPQYNIEGNIDFYSEINNNNNNNMNDVETVNHCLITGEPLVKHYQTLECGHIFNYIPLYLYVKQSKYKFNYLEHTPLKITQIKCPYCRNIQNELLPYIEEFDFPKIPGVNHLDIQYKSFFGRCEYVNYKKIQCMSNRVYLLNDRCLCYTHRNIVIHKEHKKKQLYKIKIGNINNEISNSENEYNIKKDENSEISNYENNMVDKISDPIEPVENIEPNITNTCKYIYIKGISKGCHCNKKIENINETYCKQHKNKKNIK
jgi:hypothetical protein